LSAKKNPGIKLKGEYFTPPREFVNLEQSRNYPARGESVEPAVAVVFWRITPDMSV
jgi:hypothetical protein